MNDGVRQIARGAATILWVIVCLVVFGTNAASAQSSDTSGYDQLPSGNTATPAPANPDDMWDALSNMKDEEAREQLFEEIAQQILDREAERANQESVPIHVLLARWVDALQSSLFDSVTSIPAIPEATRTTFANFQTQRGEVPLWRSTATFVLAITVGLTVFFGLSFLVRRREDALAKRAPDALRSRISILTSRFFLQGFRLVGFLVGAFAINALVNQAIPADKTIVRFLIASIGWTWFAYMIAKFLFSPVRPELRLCDVDDKTAAFLVRRIAITFGWSAFSVGGLVVIQQFGWPQNEARLDFWFSLIFHGLIILTIWQARDPITKMVQGVNPSETWQKFGRTWPYIAIGVVVLEWLVIELYVATGNIENLSLAAINLTLVIILAMPLAESVYPAVMHALWPNDPEASEGRQEAARITRQGVTRLSRSVGTYLVIIFLFWIWGVDIWNVSQQEFTSQVTSQSFGAQIASLIAQLLLIVLVGYVLWDLLNIVAYRYMALERATIEEDPTARGGLGIGRLDSVVPLLRGFGKITITVFFALAILGQMGINVLPLLAGAGVIGVAIGFGAQALVKDVISGVFFLIDDAFRKDEYIDIGTIMGTVEKISVRSFQLRHHDGLLHTIPFGEVTHVTNYSRDWGIMRLLIRVPFDTDVDRMGELVNQVGKEMKEDKEVGHMFTVGPTSQGVVDTDDSALVFRIAFMTKALDQWAVRGHVYARLREMFAKEGIKWAHREVTVNVDDDFSDQPKRKKSPATRKRTRRKAATGAATSRTGTAS